MKKKSPVLSGIICLLVVLIIFGYMGHVMGLPNMLNTMMKTAHGLLLDTVFYIMAICVLTGALSKIFAEFGVVDLIQKILRPIMKPLWNMPGSSSLGAVITFLSDNPAIVSLAKDKHFARYFKKYQFASLTNFGTSFGMGLVVVVFMMGQGFIAPTFVGLAGAVVGSIISTRLMHVMTLRKYPEYKEQNALSDEEMAEIAYEESSLSDIAAGESAGETTVCTDGDNIKPSFFSRCLDSLLDGGKSGVQIGMAIIPGVLIITTLMMMLTFGAGDTGYTGAAYQGTGLLTWLAGKIDFLFDWLFGFKAPELVAFPITALGAVGAAISLVPKYIADGIVDGNVIAVLTAIGVCWSGFMATHTALMDSIGERKLVSQAIISHTIGGLAAGIITHWAYVGMVALGWLSL